MATAMATAMTSRSYSELVKLPTFSERYNYLRLVGQVGSTTFGFDRYLNQSFYTSRDWRQVRHAVIARDAGCDLGLEGYEIFDRVYVHHMNPLTKKQVLAADENMFDLEYLISCTLNTHNAIHYGDPNSLVRLPPERRPGDTTLW